MMDEFFAEVEGSKTKAEIKKLTLDLEKLGALMVDMIEKIESRLDEDYEKVEKIEKYLRSKGYNI